MASLSQLRRARAAAKKAGVRLRSVGDGDNHHLHFTFPSGRKIVVWYPWSGRSNNLEEEDLEEVINEMERMQNPRKRWTYSGFYAIGREHAKRLLGGQPLPRPGYETKTSEGYWLANVGGRFVYQKPGDPQYDSHVREAE